MPHGPPPTRTLVLFITASTLLFQLYLFSALGTLSPSLSSAIGDEEGEWRVKLEAIQSLLVMGRLWTLSSAGIAVVGLYGISKDLPPLLRLTTLHQFLSASGDLLLLALAAFISLSSLSSTTFCEALATSELSSSFDIFGWTVEACEEQSSSLVLSVLGFVAAITLVRAWAAFQMLSYYSAITKRAKRKGLSINTRDRYLGDNGSARGDAVSPGGGSSAGGGGNSGKRGGGGGAGGARIFLLPRPMDGSLQASDIPLLSLTPSSPGYVSFPPAPSYQPSAVGGSSEQQFLVYAPVLMTEEQALQLQAKEVRFSRPRSRSHTAPSPLSAPPSATSPIGPSLGSLLMESGEEDALNGKGKLA